MNIELFNVSNYSLELPRMDAFFSTSVEQLKKLEVGGKITGLKKVIMGNDKIVNTEEITVTLIHKSDAYLVLHLYKPAYRYNKDGTMRTPEYVEAENKRHAGDGVWMVEMDTTPCIETVHIIDLKDSGIELGKIGNDSLYPRSLGHKVCEGLKVGDSFEYTYSSSYNDCIVNFSSTYPCIKTPSHQWKKKYKGQILDLCRKYTTSVIKDIIKFSGNTYILLECHGIYPGHKSGPHTIFSDMQWQNKLTEWKFFEKDVLLIVEIQTGRHCSVCANYLGQGTFKIYNDDLFKFDEVDDYKCSVSPHMIHNPFTKVCDSFCYNINYGTIIE